MKKLQVAFAALAAVAGIGGAYATTHASSSTTAGTVYNWYTKAGGYVFSGTLAQATVRCNGVGTICLRGTAPGKVQTLFTAPK